MTQQIKHRSTKLQPGCSYVTAVVTISDRGSKGEREDASGKVLSDRLHEEGYAVQYRTVVPDEVERISETLRNYADKESVALIVTTGGTGVSPRDVTPEATQAVVDRTLPGMAEAMRASSLLKTPHAMISRAVVGIRGATLIVNLPGSPRGAIENLEVVLPALPHALSKIQGDTSECAVM
ncbi:MAG: molybdenum cofactor biosynthesis protein B [Syntrophobacteraceae bacterium]